MSVLHISTMIYARAQREISFFLCIKIYQKFRFVFLTIHFHEKLVAHQMKTSNKEKGKMC